MIGFMILLAALWLPAVGKTVPEAGESMDSLTSRVFGVAGQQSLLMAAGLNTDEFPRSVNKEKGTLVTARDTWWCSGFFPGVLWEIYDYSRDDRFLEEAVRQTEKLSGLLDKTTDHDLGFMIGCSYGNGYRLTGNEDYLPVLSRAAAKLAARYDERTGVIRSWNGGEDRGWKYPVIIDNMMNLELLMDGYRWFGAEVFRDIAVRHSETTMKNHFREDGSSFHLVDYEPEDGSVRKQITVQGYADSTTWARGEAWGLYGYVMMYRQSGVSEFLEHAEKVARWILAHLPDDGVPYWDYSQRDVKDASAAAIMASAFVQLYEMTGAAEYLDAAEREIRTLASPEYMAEVGTNCGFILRHSVGSLPGRSEVDVPLTYPDYYFLEALLKYRRATSHPRLFADDRDFDMLRSRIVSSPGSDVGMIHRRVLDLVASDDDAPLIKEYDENHKRILGVARKAVSRIFSNAYMYRFSGDPVYLEKAERSMNEVCDFDGWNPPHFLDVAELAFAVSVGYDWLYHSLRPETLRKVERAVREYAFKPAAVDSVNNWFYHEYTNWNQVCNCGLMTAAVATREASDTMVRRILSKGVETGRNCVEAIYSPSGNYAEGPGYWSYGTMFQCVLNTMLDYSFGSDFGLSEISGFDLTAEYVLRCYGATHCIFNYNDNAQGEGPSIPLWYFASRFDMPSVLVLEKGFLRDGQYPLDRMLPMLTLWAKDDTSSVSEYPEGRVFSASGENPVITARGNWTSSESDWYLGIKGGTADCSHGHIDGGSFVFDAFGHRWVSDPGPASYVESEIKCAQAGGGFWEYDQNSPRWDIFPLSSDYHSVMTVDGHRFLTEARGEILDTFDMPGRWGGSIDTSPYYDNLSSAARSVYTDGSSLTVIDDFESPEVVPVRWTLVTQAVVAVHKNYVVLSYGRKSMRLEMTGAQRCSYAVRNLPEGTAGGLTFIDITFTAPAGRTTLITTLCPN